MLQLTRLPDWERRFTAVAEAHVDTPFQWGQCDCLLAVADVVEAVTGVDPAAKIRGRYTTELGAAKLMRRRKFNTVEDVLKKLFPRVGRLMARRGDICTIERNGEIVAGYVTMHGVAFQTPRGVSLVPQTDVNKAFSVG